MVVGQAVFTEFESKEMLQELASKLYAVAMAH